MENVWHYLRANKLSLLVWDSYEAIFAACKAAWDFLISDTGRIRSIGTRVWTYVNTFRRKSGWKDYDAARRLSATYILEELALNLRIRSRWKLTDEFYIGSQMLILPELFHGRHSWYLKSGGLTESIDVLGARFLTWGAEAVWTEWQRTAPTSSLSNIVAAETR
jgi:hypothetical protein